MSSSARLKSERTRLGHSQETFSAYAGVARRTLVDWEKGTSAPTSVHLARLADQGADIQYIVTGERTGSGISAPAVHQAVLDAVYFLSLDAVNAEQLANAVTKLVLKGVERIP